MTQHHSYAACFAGIAIISAVQSLALVTVLYLLLVGLNVIALFTGLLPFSLNEQLVTLGWMFISATVLGSLLYLPTAWLHEQLRQPRGIWLTQLLLTHVSLLLIWLAWQQLQPTPIGDVPPFQGVGPYKMPPSW